MIEPWERHWLTLAKERAGLALLAVLAFQRLHPLGHLGQDARARTSAENVFVVLLIMLHPAQALEPPANPARLSDVISAYCQIR